ncbi:MAG: multidrug efflux pump subunit AcrB [Candidatus Paceibacteria bacterium]|jgi:multidrug efflux pump subunit AcrB
MNKFWKFFINNRQFSYIILIALVFLGTQSLLTIPRESSPEVQVPIAIVTTPFPGSSAVDVERLVTNEIESQLSSSLENVNKITSTSADGISSIVVEFNADADIDESVRDTKDEVDKVKSELPDEANDPVVSEVNFVDEPIMFISIQTDLPDIGLINLADSVEDELEKIKGVSRVEAVGLPEREVQVIVKREALTQYGISILDITSALRSANNSLPVGSIELDGVSYSVTFEGNINDPNEIKDISIGSPSGKVVYIRDIAEVVNGTTNRSNMARVSIDGGLSDSAISLQVFKRKGGDVTRLSREIRESLKDMEDGVLKEVPYLVSFDTGEFVKDDLKNLSFTALQTILLVMIILFITIGWKEAILSGLTIPLSFMVAFIGLKASGNTINFVSLFALILSVGILVDSAIVVVESIHTKMKAMNDKVESAKMTIEEFYYPLTSGTTTTIAVFAPLFLLSGVTGQFIASIPFTIIFVLVASLFVALGVVPLMASIFLTRRNNSKMEERQEEWTRKIQDRYKKFLLSFLESRKKQNNFLKLMIGGFFIALLFPILGIIKVEFFPQEDIDFMFIEIEKPQGTLIEVTDLSVREVEEYLYNNENIDSFTTEVGAGSSFASSGSSSGEKFGNVTIILKKDRKKTSSEIVEDVREELSKISSATVRVLQPNNGPPTGDPVSIKFFSDDLGNLNKAVLSGEKLLNSIEGATGVNSSAKSDATEFKLTVDRAKASQFGLNPTTIAITLRTAIFGTDATTINNIDGDIDVVVKLDLNDKGYNPNTTTETTIDSIKNISLPTPKGSVLVGSLVTTTLDTANTAISHEDSKRIGSVSSQVEEGANVREIIKEFEDRQGEMNLPDGTEISFGGETEDVNESFKEMGIAVLLGILIVASILVLQFKSFRQALFVIAIIPLSLIGVFVGLAVSGKALSFPSMMGFIALSGIVVNNSIILIDNMNRTRKEYPHYPIDDVVLKGATSRLRPILLTTFTTVVGIFPLTYASGLWAPLAFSIMFGLTFAVIVTLILVPIMYSRWPGTVE